MDCEKSGSPERKLGKSGSPEKIFGKHWVKVKTVRVTML